MSKRKKPPATPGQVDAAFDALDKALRATGRLLAVDEDDIRSSETDIDLEGVELPEALHDPMITLQRGSHILENGFSIGDKRKSVHEGMGRHLAQAARNGNQISDNLLQRMHKDRGTARNKRKTRG